MSNENKSELQSDYWSRLAREIEGNARQAMPLIDWSQEAFRLRQTEVAFLTEKGHTEASIRETNRRIAEALFRTAISSGCGFDTVHQSFFQLSNLGFTTVEGRFIQTMIFARACGWLGETEHGIAVLQTLLTDLQNNMLPDSQSAIDDIRKLICTLRDN